MWDLAAAAFILLAVSGCLYWLGFRIAAGRSKWLVIAFTLSAAVFILVYGMVAHGKLIVATVLPFSSAIILGNGLVLLAALLAGLVAGQQNIARWRRTLLVVALIAVGIYCIVCDFVGPRVVVRKFQLNQGVCLQSSAETCSPAAAVTLLKHHGVESTEREMIELCLTRQRGTPPLGLYRGMKIKTRDTEWGVEVFRGTIDQLLAMPQPLLLRVRFAENDRDAQADWAWSTGFGHVVVCYGMSEDGRIEVGDPACGRVNWTVEDLQRRWRGEGIRLVPVSGP